MMACKDKSIIAMACKEVLQSFSLSETEASIEHNLHCGHAYHESLIWQRVAVEDALEMACILDAKRQNVECIIEEEQTHKAQVAALSQMQLQALQRVEEQEKEMQRLSALLVEHQVTIQISPPKNAPQ